MKRKNPDIVIRSTDRTEETVRLIARDLLPRWKEQGRSYAKTIRSKDEKEVAKILWGLCRRNIAYREDPLGQELIRSPRQTWSYRAQGVDCEDFVIFCGSILLCLGMKFTIRTVDYGSGWEHIYIVMPDGTVLDPVSDVFNFESFYMRKMDIAMGAMGKGLGRLKYGDVTISTDKGMMYGYYGEEVDMNDDLIRLPKGLFVSDAFLFEGVEKGKGAGQELYLTALNEYHVLYSSWPISEDAQRVHDALVRKGLAKEGRFKVKGTGYEFKVLYLPEKVKKTSRSTSSTPSPKAETSKMPTLDLKGLQAMASKYNWAVKNNGSVKAEYDFYDSDSNLKLTLVYREDSPEYSFHEPNWAIITKGNTDPIADAEKIITQYFKPQMKPASTPSPKAKARKGSNQVETNRQIVELLEKIGTNPAAYTAEEIEFINEYEGSGGQGKNGADGEGLLYEFYTPDWLAFKMYELARYYGYKPGQQILEPSCGTGRLVKPFGDYENITAFEINPVSAQIARINCPGMTVYNQYFEMAFLKEPRFNVRVPAKELTWLDSYPFDLVIGNPPYGIYKNQYSSYFNFEKKTLKQFEFIFMYWGLQALRKGGLLIYLVPQNMMRNGDLYQKAKEAIEPMAELLDAYRLPTVFRYSKVPTDIIILRKK